MACGMLVGSGGGGEEEVKETRGGTGDREREIMKKWCLGRLVKVSVDVCWWCWGGRVPELLIGRCLGYAARYAHRL